MTEKRAQKVPNEPDAALLLRIILNDRVGALCSLSTALLYMFDSHKIVFFKEG